MRKSVVVPIVVILLIALGVLCNFLYFKFTGSTKMEYKYIGIVDVTPQEYSEFSGCAKVLGYEDNSTIKVYVDFTSPEYYPAMDGISSRVSVVDGVKVMAVALLSILYFMAVGVFAFMIVWEALDEFGVDSLGVEY